MKIFLTIFFTFLTVFSYSQIGVVNTGTTNVAQALTNQKLDSVVLAIKSKYASDSVFIKLNTQAMKDSLHLLIIKNGGVSDSNFIKISNVLLDSIYRVSLRLEAQTKSDSVFIKNLLKSNADSLHLVIVKNTSDSNFIKQLIQANKDSFHLLIVKNNSDSFTLKRLIDSNTKYLSMILSEAYKDTSITKRLDSMIKQNYSLILTAQAQLKDLDSIKYQKDSTIKVFVVNSDTSISSSLRKAYIQDSLQNIQVNKVDSVWVRNIADTSNQYLLNLILNKSILDTSNKSILQSIYTKQNKDTSNRYLLELIASKSPTDTSNQFLIQSRGDSTRVGIDTTNSILSNVLISSRNKEEKLDSQVNIQQRIELVLNAMYDKMTEQLTMQEIDITTNGGSAVIPVGAYSITVFNYGVNGAGLVFQDVTYSGGFNGTIHTPQVTETWNDKNPLYYTSPITVTFGATSRGRVIYLIKL
jgi:hypothetical protein